MVKYKISHQDRIMNDIYHALADETRRKILAHLTRNPLTISKIAKPFSVSLPAISKQIKVLEKAKLIGRIKQGKHYQISLKPDRLKLIEKHIGFYKQFWNDRLDQLEKLLERG